MPDILDQLPVPPGCANGTIARAALRHWRTSLAGRSSPEAHLRIGAGVWYRAPSGWRRCQVHARDRLSDRWLLIDIDHPRTQVFVHAGHIFPRYAGELAPGLAAPATGGAA